MPLDDIPDPEFRRSVMAAELLDAETETELAVAWRDKRDEKSLHRLINAYTRLAISMAGKFRRYGVSMPDLTQEASVGLMKAAEKFDPDRGVRFSTYARWWIKASLQDFILRNYSLVRTGSTTNQKSLFFNLKRIKAKFTREAEQRGEEVNGSDMRDKIAAELGVPLRDVEMMEGRLSGSDFSLNAVQSQDEDSREWLDLLQDEGPQAEDIVTDDADQGKLSIWLTDAMQVLNDRERYIVAQRTMLDQPRTLDSIGQELNLSKERIRQIESAALAKLRKRLSTGKTKPSDFLIDA